jgi:processive 1,2-diacylglycerol beta-glucosyltransferase
MKKIMIFTSSGGYGHISATQALTEYLSPKYHILQVYVLEEVLGTIDFIYYLTLGKFSAESLYNYCITRKWFRLLNLMLSSGYFYFWLFDNKVTSLLRNHIIKHKPDMIISVTPMVNGSTLKVCKELNIPFVVIPTDFDVTTFINRLQEPDYDKFFFNLVFSNEFIINQTIKPAKIPQKNIISLDFPLKQSFYAPYEKDSIMAEFDIPNGKQVIMLLMGGQGAEATIDFAKQLAQLQKDVHILLCIGKREEVRDDIEKINFNDGITYSIISFTSKIAVLMSLADLIITKSGSVTVHEALFMQLPMILDGTTPVLPWEKFNHAFIEKKELGASLKNLADLTPLLNDLLRNPDKLQRWHNNLHKIKHKDAPKEVCAFIDSLFN